MPLVLDHSWAELSLLAKVAMGFVLIVAAASANYLFNDIVDLKADQRHPSKRFRPVAAETITVRAALWAAGTVAAVALGLAFMLDFVFALTLSGYLALSLCYSLWLKRIRFLNTLTIAVFLSSRLVMGGALVGTAPSAWLLVYAILLFFSLASAKHYIEALSVPADDADYRLRYNLSDAPVVLSLGALAGALSVLVFGSYLVEGAFETVGYTRPQFLWGAVAVIAFWTSRIWWLAYGDSVHDDPVHFALSDWLSWLCAFIVGLFFFAAL